MFRFVVGTLALCFSSAWSVRLVAAPNLVPNPSFEQNTQCPSQIDLVTGQIHYATSWSRARSTPDYFHHCGLIASVRTPDNAMGTQCPYGSTCGSIPPGGYGGFVAYQAQATDARELIQSSLTSPLTAGQKYRVRFYVSLAEFFEYGVDRLGAHLQAGAVDPNNPPAMAMQVQNAPGNVITNKTQWTMITGKFTAAGGEDHIVLGNLASDAITQVLSTGSGGFAQAYYYIDMVSVRRADITDITVLPPPGGGGDVWEAQLTGGAPNSPAWLYCSGTRDGSDIDGHEFDLGGTPLEIAQASTDASGNAIFRFSLSAASACANVLGQFYLEARVDDPASGETSDSDEETVDTTPTDVAPGGTRAVGVGRIAATPNPFNPETTLRFELLQPSRVHVELFDVAGKRVRTWTDRNLRASGWHAVPWDGTDQAGRAMNSGVYYYRVTAGAASRTAAIVLAK